MTTSSPPPEWLRNFKPDQPPQPSPAGGRHRWQPGIKSPNPSGRPPGIVDKRQRIAQALMDDAQGIAKMVVAKALDGDLQAANIVLSRVQPVLKPRAERVRFTLDPDGSLTDQAKAVLVGIAAGEIDADTGNTLITAISSFASIREVDELRARLDALERREEAESESGAIGGVLALPADQLAALQGSRT